MFPQVTYRMRNLESFICRTHGNRGFSFFVFLLQIVCIPFSARFIFQLRFQERSKLRPLEFINYTYNLFLILWILTLQLSPYSLDTIIVTICPVTPSSGLDRRNGF